eukprot:SAG31_NODE_1883_length_6996_cov_8.247499_2_plen_102_part_00
MQLRYVKLNREKVALAATLLAEHAAMHDLDSPLRLAVVRHDYDPDSAEIEGWEDSTLTLSIGELMVVVGEPVDDWWSGYKLKTPVCRWCIVFMISVSLWSR